MIMRDLITKVPYSIKQNLKYIYRIIPAPIRYGKVFRETYAFLQESQWWSREKLEAYQMFQLSKLLRHAYENVAYYRKIFDERGLKPKDIQNFHDLKKLPYLTKEIIRENLHDLIAQNYPKSKLEYVRTGGTTGIPLGFYVDKCIADSKEFAFILTMWNRVGFKIGDKRVVLRGHFPYASREKFCKYNPIEKTLQFSSIHMSDETLPTYIKKIRNFQPDFLHVYPSTITILAKFMSRNNIEPFPSVKALLCGSENIYPWQRKFLEEIFHCRVYSWYGHGEKCVLAGVCEKSNYYHIFPEYGFVELYSKDGSPVEKENELGEIVATGFNNYATPFIRYKTEDIAVNSKQNCSCGRNYSLLRKIEGRRQDFFVDKTGSLITFNCSDESTWSVTHKINDFQYVQDSPGKVLLNIDARSKFTISDIEQIKRDFLKYYSDFNIDIKFVETISRTETGKFRYLIQNLPIEY